MKVNMLGDFGGHSAFARRAELYATWLGAERNARDLSLPRVVMQVLCKLHEQPVADSVVFTIFEHTRLSGKEVKLLNSARCVVVPSPCAIVCRQSGVKVPVVPINYGLPEVFTYTATATTSGLVYLTAGRPQHGERKDIYRVICAFLSVFKGSNAAVLQVKLPGDAPLPDIRSAHVQYITDDLSEQDMARWYSQGVVFISPSHGEGWGLHEHEAMACGRSVVSTCKSGLCKSLPQRMLYPVRSTTVNHYHIPNFDDLRRAIVEVAGEPILALMKGRQCALEVEKYTLEAERKVVRETVYKYA